MPPQTAGPADITFLGAYSPAQDAEARRIAELAYAASYGDFLHMARMLVSRHDDRPLERGELQVRECVYRFGARVVEAAFRVWNERPQETNVLLLHRGRDDRTSPAIASSPRARILPLGPSGPRAGHPA